MQNLAPIAELQQEATTCTTPTKNKSGRRRASSSPSPSTIQTRLRSANKKGTNDNDVQNLAPIAELQQEGTTRRTINSISINTNRHPASSSCSSSPPAGASPSTSHATGTRSVKKRFVGTNDDVQNLAPIIAELQQDEAIPYGKKVFDAIPFYPQVNIVTTMQHQELIHPFLLTCHKTEIPNIFKSRQKKMPKTSHYETNEKLEHKNHEVLKLLTRQNELLLTR